VTAYDERVDELVIEGLRPVPTEDRELIRERRLHELLSLVAGVVYEAGDSVADRE